MNLVHGPICVPLDGSAASEAAVRPALALASLYGQPVHFVHVVDVENGADGSSPVEYEGRFQDYLEQLLEKSGTGDVAHTSQLAVGSPAPTILGLAGDAALIVMATHGRGGFHATFIGSVTDKVVRTSKLPVLTVPVNEPFDLRSGPVLVGLDGSETAEQSLDPARDLAQKLGTEIVLLRAFTMVPSTGTEFIMYEYNAVETLKQAAEEYLAKAARPGEKTMTAMMSPSVAIEQAADQIKAGVIVLTTRGRGLAGRLTLGSVTDRVVHSVRRPILVFPSGE